MAARPLKDIMQVQTHGSNGPTNIIAKAARPRRRKPLHLPLALEARAAGAPFRQSGAPVLSGRELRRIVAGMLG
jgi:hypothetical protein